MEGVKRKAWSVEKALEMLKIGKMQANVCKELGVTESPLRGWIKMMTYHHLHQNYMMP